MNRQLAREQLINQYRSYASLVTERGLPYKEFDDPELDALSDEDLKFIVRGLKELARTPMQ